MISLTIGLALAVSIAMVQGSQERGIAVPGAIREWVGVHTDITEIKRAWTGEAPAEFAHMADWFKRDDPVLQAAREMAETEIFSRDEIEALDADVQSQMGLAVQFALESPMPEPETAFEDVWPA